MESAIDLPELPPSSGSPDWRIYRTSGTAPDDPVVLLGSETVYYGVGVRSYSSGNILRLKFDDTGTFEIRPASREIAWYPGANTTTAAIRADLLGRVIALASQSVGWVPLHASAVSIAGRGIAFLGPKRAGKSTLALALVRAGARLLTDDLLVVRFGAAGSAWVAPGVQRVRLWDDSARALDASTAADDGAKPTVDCLTPEELEGNEVPLAACYVLEAAEDDAADAVSRDRLTSVAAALAYVRYSKLGALAGGALGPVMLERSAELSRIVPVFSARVRRDLGALDRVAAAFHEWHASAQAMPAGAMP